MRGYLRLLRGYLRLSGPILDVFERRGVVSVRAESD